jgi:hypothetical protein
LLAAPAAALLLVVRARLRRPLVAARTPCSKFISANKSQKQFNLKK